MLTAMAIALPAVSAPPLTGEWTFDPIFSLKVAVARSGLMTIEPNEIPFFLRVSAITFADDLAVVHLDDKSARSFFSLRPLDDVTYLLRLGPQGGFRTDVTITDRTPDDGWFYQVAFMDRMLEFGRVTMQEIQPICGPRVPYETQIMIAPDEVVERIENAARIPGVRLRHAFITYPEGQPPGFFVAAMIDDADEVGAWLYTGKPYAVNSASASTTDLSSYELGPHTIPAYLLEYVSREQCLDDADAAVAVP